MPASSITGIGRSVTPSFPTNSKCKTIVYVDVDTVEEADLIVKNQMLATADYVITRTGKVVKSRDGNPPPVIPRPQTQEIQKETKYRSIDDA